MSDEYDYEIITEKLNPPLGENCFAAKVQFMVRRLEPGRTERVYPSIGEMWGRTEQEAYQKVRQAVEDWIAGRQT